MPPLPVSPCIPPGAILSPPSSTAGQCTRESDHDDDEELVTEMDAELTAAWSLTNKEAGDTENTQAQGGCDDQMTGTEKSPEARVVDHSYLVKLAVSDSPSPPSLSEVKREDQTQPETEHQMNNMTTTSLMTFTEEVLVTSETDI